MFKGIQRYTDEYKGTLFGAIGQLYRRVHLKGAEVISIFFNEGSMDVDWCERTKFKSLFFI